MEFKKIWWLWLILIILLIIIFPKTCGKTDFISNTIKYKCGGIKAPFINIHTNFSWCYGICLESSIINRTSNQIVQENNAPAIILEFMTPILKIVPIIFGIIMLIIFLRWITFYRKK